MNNDLEHIERRLARIESRLVQLMIHMGSDPYGRTYDNLSSAKHTNAVSLNTQSQRQAERIKARGTGGRTGIRNFFARTLFS